MADRDSILTKLEALMKRTRENGASEAEVESAMAVARKLMDEHNVAMEEVLGRQVAGGQATIEVTEEEVRSTTTVRIFERYLMDVVCGICDVKWFQRVDRQKFGKTTKLTHYFFYGMKQDVFAAKLLFLELLITVRVMAVAKIGSGGGKLQMRRNTYCDGFCAGLSCKASQLKEQSRRDTPTTGTSLVLRKDVAIQRYAEDVLHLQEVAVRPIQKERLMSHEFNMGWRDGAEYELNPQNKPHVTQKTNHLN